LRLYFITFLKPDHGLKKMNAKLIREDLIQQLVYYSFRFLDLSPNCGGYCIVVNWSPLKLLHIAFGDGVLWVLRKLIIKGLDEFDIDSNTWSIWVLIEDGRLTSGSGRILKMLDHPTLDGLGHRQMLEVYRVS
jgi:hypothetical protein